MDIDELALKQQATDDRSIRNEARIKKLEAENKSLHDLATSVAVMAEQLKSMNTNVSTLKTDVEEMKGKPAKRWDDLLDKVIWAVAAALIGYVLSKIGM
jgi:hypothetical protein